MNTYCGREFSPGDIEAIKRLMEQDPSLLRTTLSRRLCELLGWTKPNGELKDMTCRVALLRMQSDGLITLPPSRRTGPRRKPHFPPTAATDPQSPLKQPVHELGALGLHRVSTSTSSRLAVLARAGARHRLALSEPLARLGVPVPPQQVPSWRR